MRYWLVAFPVMLIGGLLTDAAFHVHNLAPAILVGFVWGIIGASCGIAADR